MTTAEKFVRASSEMGRLEARLAELRAERVRLLRLLRDEGMTEAELVKLSGLTRQRLWQLMKEHGE